MLALTLFFLVPSTQDLATLPAPDTSSLTAGGLVWSYAPPGLVVSGRLGDRGGLVVGRNTAEELFLLSSFDADPPEPIWTAADSVGAVAVASECDVFLLAEMRENPPFHSIWILKKYRSRSRVPEWRYAFTDQVPSAAYFDVSRDGETIVSGFSDEASSRTLLRVHDAATGEVTRTIVLPDEVSPHFDLSPDGSIAALSGPGYTVVYEIATGRRLSRMPGYIAGEHSLSSEGRRLVVTLLTDDDPPEHHVQVYSRAGDGYELTLDVSTPLYVRPIDLAVSEDGSTMVGCWHGLGGPQRAIVRAFEVETGAMTMEHVDVGPELYPSGIAVSADGSRFVACLAGTGAGAVPELALYSKDSGVPIATHRNGGSVYSVQMSPDGKRYLANRAPTNRGYDHTMIELYELGGEDFVVRGRPSVGETITFELHGAPGSRAALLRSFALAPEPIVFPRIGTLHLDPATLSSTPMGVVPPSGVATYSTVASTVPGMIGRTLWFQGITSRPRRLTTDFVQLTILP